MTTGSFSPFGILSVAGLPAATGIGSANRCAVIRQQPLAVNSATHSKLQQ